MEKNQIYTFEDLLNIIGILRSPEGCLWDRQQTSENIGNFLLDEAYEVLDAIDTGTSADLKEELGDLLFQILFLAKIAEEADAFTISDVINEIAKKMIRRHPHVFDDIRLNTVEEIKSNWETIKQKEGKPQKTLESMLDLFPATLPALLKAQKISEKASKAGFDWKNSADIIDKIEEELTELKAAFHNHDKREIENEAGDLFFSLVNFCRRMDINSEKALMGTVKKFIKRFRYIEKTLLERGTNISDASLEEMDNLWNESKKLKEKKKSK